MCGARSQISLGTVRFHETTIVPLQARIIAWGPSAGKVKEGHSGECGKIKSRYLTMLIGQQIPMGVVSEAIGEPYKGWVVAWRSSCGKVKDCHGRESGQIKPCYQAMKGAIIII